MTAAQKMPTWRNRIVDSGSKPASEFLAHDLNWRVHPKAQQASLAGVLDEVGWVQNVIESARTGKVIDGHLRVTLALRRGDNTPVPYISVDVSEEEERLILATLDPLSAMAGADKGVLDALLREVQTDDVAVQEMLANLAKESGLEFGQEAKVDPGPQIDRAEELREKWGVQSGQLWQVGEHRLLCGDSTKPEDVARLMGGQKALMVFTDPPYMIMGSSSGVKSDANISLPFFRGLWTALVASGAIEVYVCCDWRSYPSLYTTCLGYDVKDVIVWDKQSGGLGNPYRRRHEFILFARPADSGAMMHNAKGIAAISITDDDVWTCVRENDKAHNAQKPVAIATRAMRNSTEVGAMVFDPFLGYGTTMVAAEQLGRVCYGMEIDPRYVAVTLERMAGMALVPRLTDE